MSNLSNTGHIWWSILYFLEDFDAIYGKFWLSIPIDIKFTVIYIFITSAQWKMMLKTRGHTRRSCIFAYSWVIPRNFTTHVLSDIPVIRLDSSGWFQFSSTFHLHSLYVVVYYIWGASWNIYFTWLKPIFHC